MFALQRMGEHDAQLEKHLEIHGNTSKKMVRSIYVKYEAMMFFSVFPRHFKPPASPSFWRQKRHPQTPAMWELRPFSAGSMQQSSEEATVLKSVEVDMA